MGLMEQLGGMLGGAGGNAAGGAGGAGGGADVQQLLGRFMGGGANFNDPHSQDRSALHGVVGHASDDDLTNTFSHAARNMDGAAYRDHVTPGVGGTDPLGGLGQGGLGAIAGALRGNLGGGSGGGMAGLLGKVPGLSHTDPNRMSSQEVAALADYTRQHHPDAFGRAAAQVGRQDPNLLQQLMGNPAMMSAAMSLASKFMKR